MCFPLFLLSFFFIKHLDSAPFSEAPPAIMESLNRLTWAGSEAVRGQYYPPRNELVAVGYMETQRMGVSLTQLSNHSNCCSLIQCSGMMMGRESWTTSCQRGPLAPRLT